MIANNRTGGLEHENVPDHSSMAIHRKKFAARRAPKTSQGLSTLSPDGLYRQAQFCPTVLPFGRTRWYEGVKSGEFPAPVVQRKRCTLWRGADILALAEKLARGSV